MYLFIYHRNSISEVAVGGWVLVSELVLSSANSPDLHESVVISQSPLLSQHIYSALRFAGELLGAGQNVTMFSENLQMLSCWDFGRAVILNPAADGQGSLSRCY
jgi:hypothetical protein